MHQIPQPKNQANLLKDFLKAKGIKLGHQDALEAVAVLMGFKNWKTMSAAGYKQAALLTGHESDIAENYSDELIKNMQSIYGICLPGEADFKEHEAFLKRGLKSFGYTQCSQWLSEEMENADVAANFDIEPIQSMIDSGEIVFGLENTNFPDVSAYRVRKAKGWVELVNVYYSSLLHDTQAPRDEGRFGYDVWRFDRTGTLLAKNSVAGLHSLKQALAILTASHGFGNKDS